MTVSEGNRQAVGRVAQVVLLCLAGALALAPGAASATGSSEPNDSTLGAAGPLEYGQTYSAGMETPGDTDFYFFYVTSQGPSPVTLAAANLGGGAPQSVIDVTIANSFATPLGAISYLAPGTQRAVTVNLPPQRYLVEVTTNQAFSQTSGTLYSLSAGGSGGAFGPYAQIARHCARAARALARAKTRLRRARTRMRARRRARRAAIRSRHPWCSIPQ